MKEFKLVDIFLEYKGTHILFAVVFSKEIFDFIHQLSRLPHYACEKKEFVALIDKILKISKN